MRFSELTTEIWKKIDAYYKQQEHSTGTLLSESIKFLRIFVGVPWRGASNDSGVVRTGSYGKFGRHIFRAVIADANIILRRRVRRREAPYRLSSDPNMLDFEWPWGVINLFLWQFDYIFLPRFRRQLCENEWKYFHTVSDKNVRQAL